MIAVHFLIEGTQHAATFSAQFVLKPLVQMRRQVADTPKSEADGRGAPVQNPQDQDAGRKGPAHAAGRGSFLPFLIGLHSPPASVESGGDLGRGRFNLQIKNRCDRSEDGFASMVTLFAVLLGQPACPFGEDGDAVGLDGL